MSELRDKFWERYSLDQLNDTEWEALCDGCGKCCTIKLEEDDGSFVNTCVACKLLDTETCRCSDYENRRATVPECLSLSPKKIERNDVDVLRWMPASCAYKRLNDKQTLPEWHYLICGDRQQVHELGHSVRDKVISEQSVHDDELELYIVDF